MYSTPSTSEEPAGLHSRRYDTLNSGPPSMSHRIPMRAAQISSAIHSVLDPRQPLTFTSRAHPRPILPVPPTTASRRLQPPLGSHPRVQHIGDYPLPNTNTRNDSKSTPSFVMFKPEEGSESASNHDGSDVRAQDRSRSQSAGELSSSRNRNPTDADWNQYKSVITRLYWDENLSMPVVRDYMIREFGFDATPRAYKFRFRKWGLRKNIKEREALEIVAGQRNPNEFWAGNKRVNFERRIARHLEKDGGGGGGGGGAGGGSQEVEQLSKADLASLASRVSSSGGPRRMSAPDFFERLEDSLFDVNEWLAANRHRQDWFGTRLDLGEDENFFPLFTRGLSTLARGDLAQQPTAWADINRAFDHVKGLIASHHPLAYLRLVGRAASFKYYPDAPICLDVCRLLLKHAYELFREMHPNCHLLQAIWQSQLGAIKAPVSCVPGSMEHSINVTTSLCGMQWCDTKEGINLGSLCIERYVPSEMRSQDEKALRATLERANSDLSPLAISLAQETRLALAERLIEQERMDEGQRLVEDALAFRDLDGLNTEGKLFWMAELEWRMGSKDASIVMLEEALAVVDAAALEGEARPIPEDPTWVDNSVDGALSAMHVLGILAHRLNIMGRGNGESAARKRLSSMLTKVQREWGCAFTLHLVIFDLEVEMDPEAVKEALEGLGEAS